MNVPATDALCIMVLKDSENFEEVYVIRSSEFGDEIKSLKDVFVKKDVKEFLTSLENKLKELRSKSRGLESLGDAVNVMDFGAGKIISISLGKVPEDVGLIKFAKRVWKNPKKEDEIYISYEVALYSGGKQIDSLQRVLVMKENVLYDVTLKV